MLKSIITHEGDTLFMDFPCRRMLMAEHLASIGIKTPAHEIRCANEEDEPIKVKIYGTSEFENRLASFVSSENTLSFVNTICEIYHNLPYANKLDMMDAVLNGKVSSFEEFGRMMLERRMSDTTEHYYCPLTATLYPRNEYGDLENFSEEYDGEYLAPYEENIRELIAQYDRPESFFYCDPPYYSTEDYYEDVGFTVNDHARLADVLCNINGKFLLSYRISRWIQKGIYRCKSGTQV